MRKDRNRWVRLAIAGLVVLILCGLGAAPVGAATTIGSDLSGTPTSGCVVPPNQYLCTITQLTPSAGDPYSLTAPTPGVITQIRLKHGTVGVTGNTVGFRILTATSSPTVFGGRIASPTGTEGSFATSTGAAVDSFGFQDYKGCPVGVPIQAGERLGIYMGSPDLPVVSATGADAGELPNENHYQGEQTYQSRSGELLVQATIEPDANGDGYGDESQSPSCGEPPHPQIEVYTAPTIKKFPSHAPIKKIISHGFHGSVSCGGPCNAVQEIWLWQINSLIYNAYARSQRSASRIVIAKTAKRLSGGGRVALVSRVKARAKRFLTRSPFKRIEVIAATKVTDERGSHAKKQKITLTR